MGPQGTARPSCQMWKRRKGRRGRRKLRGRRGSGLPWALALHPAATRALGSEALAHPASAHDSSTERGPRPPSTLCADRLVSVPQTPRGGKGRGGRPGRPEEAGAGGGHCPATQTQGQGPFQEPLPLPYCHQREGTRITSRGAISPGPGRPVREAVRSPAPSRGHSASHIRVVQSCLLNEET